MKPLTLGLKPHLPPPSQPLNHPLASPQLLNGAGIGPFIPNALTTQLLKGCTPPAQTEWCFKLINFMFYGSSDYVAAADFFRVGATWPSTVSFRNLLHWSQLYHAGDGLIMFDSGTNCSMPEGGPQPFQESCNQAKYGQEQPPTYDVSRVTTKAAIFEGARARGRGGMVRAGRGYGV